MLKSLYCRVRQAGNLNESRRRSIQHKIDGQGRRSLRVEPLEDRRMLAVFTVNSVLDTVDINIGDGLAEDAAGNTTLRAAIMEANFSSSADTINLPAGTYDLTRASGGTYDDNALTGDLDIAYSVNIVGADAATTIIDADGLGDRIFDLFNFATVNISNVTITNGQADNSGVYTAEASGGAIRTYFYNHLTLTDCVISNNSAPSSAPPNLIYGFGGAIDNIGRTLTIDGCQFINNSASNSGGAIATGGTVGGENGVLTITDTTFSGNTANWGGAIKNQSDMTLDRVLITGSTGSAINNNGGGDLTIINSTLSGNQGSSGGAIINFETLRILNSTITNNSSTFSGGGIDNSGGVVEIENSIIANNSSSSASDVDGTVTSLGHNIIGDATGSTGFGATGDQLGVDPLLGPLADNGGPTLTHALLTGSPAIDAANTVAAPSVDQRGESRPAGADADIGAYEKPPAGSVEGVVYNDLSGDGVRDAGELGLEGWTVYIDENSNGILDEGYTNTTFYAAISPNIPVTIDGSTVHTSTLTIPAGAGTIDDLNVNLNISHTYDSDVKVVLKGPNALEVTLFNRVGGTGDNFTDTTLDDEASLAITAGAPPYAGDYQPDGSLSTFDGMDAAGVWTLEITDVYPSYDDGTLHAWSLEVETSAIGETSVLANASGEYQFTGLEPGAYTIGVDSSVVWDQTSPPTGFHTANVASGGTISDLDFGFKELSVVETAIIASADGEAQDEAPFDGTFETLVTNGLSLKVDYILPPYTAEEQRSMIEFDLSSVPDGATIASATLSLEPGVLNYSPPTYPTVHVYGYAGNGSIDFADATVAATELGQATVTSLDVVSISIDPAFIQSLIDNGDYAGFRLQKLVADVTSVSFHSIEWPNNKPTLTIETVQETEYDYGDAPDTGAGTGVGNYNTLKLDNGPSHAIVAGLHMGASVDIEDGTLQNVTATADDSDQAPDDEDGLVNATADLAMVVGEAPTVDVLVTNTTGSPATLYGWIDYNGDGVFDNATERAQAVVADGLAGATVTLTLPTVPGTIPSSTYARFRLSTDSAAADAIGPAADGEVEDYLVDQVTYPSRLYVDADATGANTGLDWTNAFTDLESALFLTSTLNSDATALNDIVDIRIAEGTYAPTALSDADNDGDIDGDDGPRSATFTLVDGVAIYGGYAGVGAADPNLRDVVAHETILSGDLGSNDAANIAVVNLLTHATRSENAYTVVTAKDLSGTTTLDGVTISGGNANLTSGTNTAPIRSGGGLHLSDSTPTNGELILNAVAVNNNASEFEGGGIWIGFGAISITDTAVTENYTLLGGGIRQYSGNMSLTDSTVAGNVAEGWAGGMYMNGPNIVSDIRNVAIVGNDARTATGGGVIAYGDNVKIHSSTVVGNTSYEEGGGIFGRLFMTNTIVAFNSAPVNNDIGLALNFGSGGNLTGGDPQFVRNPSLGADGKVGGGDDDYGDLHLTDQSWAIDMGRNALVPPTLTTDKDGAPRVFGSSVDIGAYEYQATPPAGREAGATVVTTLADTTDPYDGVVSLREALRYAGDGATITFDPAINGGTITLTGEALHINEATTVDASALTSLTINGDAKSRVFTTYTHGARLSGLTIIGGASWDCGGGIYQFKGELTISDTVISGNSTSYIGGGIHQYTGELTIVNSHITGNSANSGGGVNQYYGNLTIVDSLISGNSASNIGGGIRNYRDLTITNSVIADNTAVLGGGIHSYDGGATLINSTIAGNVASDSGGGIYCITGPPTLYNTIIATNVATSFGPDAFPAVTASHSLIGDGTDMTGATHGDANGNRVGTSVVPIDPLFVDSTSGNYRLLFGSPAIDAGDDAQLPPDSQDLDNDGDVLEPLPYDLDNLPRYIGINVDMGAYEFESFDFGDASDPTYPTLLANNGARHRAVGPMLGTIRDTEIDGQPSSNADGDDVTGGSNDEDGIATLPLLIPGIRQTSIDVSASGAGYLNAWIDFNANGVWEPNEQIAIDHPVIAGANQLLVDVPIFATPGETYARFRLTSYNTAGALLPTGLADDGEVEDYQFQVENDIYLEGTNNDDTVLIWPGTPGGSDHRVQINGEESYYDAAAYDTIHFDALGGNDTLNIYGKTADETATFDGTSVLVSESGVYVAGGKNFENIYVFSGGGDDNATILGTSGDDDAYINEGYSYLRGDSRSFLNYTKDFDSVTFDASSGGGHDRIYGYDSPENDTYIAGESQVEMDYDSNLTLDVDVTAIGFDVTSLYGGNGGYDVATLAGSAGNDKFTARDLYGRLVGDSGAYIHYVEGFDQVTGDVSGTTGIDVAILFDAEGDDRLEAGEASVSLDLDATPGVDEPNLIANGFDQVYAYAIRGGNDSALMTGSDSADRLTSKRTYSTLKRRDGAYFNYAAGWDEVTADVSGSAGADLAFIYDDTTNDLFEAGPTLSTLDYDVTGSPGVDTTAIGFDQVYAYADFGGNDTALLNGSAGVDKYFGLLTYSYLRADDNSYFNYARGFDAVTANAVGTGDLAFMYDSNGDDVLVANSTLATFTLNPTAGGQVVNTAAAFDQVYGYASGGGTDTANLTGTSGADAFKGDADWGYLRSTGTSDYFNYVRYFDEVFADPGDTDIDNDDLNDLGVGYALDTTPGNGNVW